MALTFTLHLFFIQFIFTAVAAIVYSCLPNATCGCSSNPVVLGKIIGGEDASTGSWGWIVSIRLSNSHICGGSLISSSLVLTAAHCLVSIKSISTITINVGSNYLSVNRQRRSVSNIYIHQDYDTTTLINDIAIMRLSSPINMNDRTIALICLPTVENVEYPPTNINVVAIGWGVVSTDEKLPSNTLQQVTLKTMSPKTTSCQRVIKNTAAQLCSGVTGGGKGNEKKFTDKNRKITRQFYLYLLFLLKIHVKVIVVVH